MDMIYPWTYIAQGAEVSELVGVPIWEGTTVYRALSSFARQELM